MGPSFEVAMLMMIICCVGGVVTLTSAALVVGHESLRPFCCLALVAFQLFVGWYRPMLGMLKGEIVPESHRATVYIIYEFFSKVSGTFLAIRSEGQAFGF